jgi:hypothetical protein
MTKVIEVNISNSDSEPIWVEAYVTWENEQNMRVTPKEGDPLHSIHIDKLSKTLYRVPNGKNQQPL